MLLRNPFIDVMLYIGNILYQTMRTFWKKFLLKRYFPKFIPHNAPHVIVTRNFDIS